MNHFKKTVTGLLTAVILISLLSVFSLPIGADVDQSLMQPVTTARVNDTDKDQPTAYTIASLSDLIYAAAHPAYFGKGDTLCLIADLDISKYNGSFAADFKNFDPTGDMSAQFNADFDGMGHTISNYSESLAFFNGCTNGVVRNLNFEKAAVRAGATQAAILMRTTETGIILDNVHIRNSVLTTQNYSYCGALISFVQNHNKPAVIRNCSVIKTHISVSYNGAAYATGLFMGRYRTASTLFIQNCVAANSSVSGITVTNNGGGLLVGDVSEKTANGQETYAVFNNVAAINCELKNYGTGSVAFAIMTVAREWATVKAKNIYAVGNKRSEQAKLNTADLPLENLFYILSQGEVALSSYKVDDGVTRITQLTNVAYSNVDTAFTASKVVEALNRSDDEDHLKWKLKNQMPLPDSEASSFFTAGDLNGDGKINDLDVMVMLKVLNGSYNGTFQKKAMFLDGDSIVTTADLTLLMKKVAGQEVSLISAPANATVSQYENGTYYYSNHTLKVISQNIFHGGSSYRVENGVDMNGTALRRERQRILMQECGYHPDVVMLQEYRHTEWFNQYEKTILPMPEYENHTVSRADPARDTTTEAYNLGVVAGAHTVATAYQPDERLAIFWRNDKFDVATDSEGNPIKGMFFFSNTPDVNSPSFGTENDKLDKYDNGVMIDNRNRICIWVKLRDLETNEEFYIYNFHFPNGMNASETIKCIDLFHNKVQLHLAQYGDAEVIAGGDMNTCYFNAEDASAIAKMGEYFDDVGEKMGDLQGTFPRFSRNITASGQITSRIDFFYTLNERTDILHYNVMEETFDANNNVLENFGGYNPYGSKSKDNVYLGYWASDHLGIFAEFALKSTADRHTTKAPVAATATQQTALPIALNLDGADPLGNLKAGETVTVTVSLKEGANLASLPLKLNYDSTVLSLIETAKDPFEGAIMDHLAFSEPLSAGFYSNKNITEGGRLMQVQFKVLRNTSLKNNPVAASVADQGAYGITRYTSAGAPVSVNSAVLTAYPLLYGDVDGNRSVETKDAVLILQQVVGMNPSGMTQPNMGELDGREGLSAADAQMILWALAHPNGT